MYNISHPKFPCRICAKNVYDKDKAVQCDLCAGAAPVGGLGGALAPPTFSLSNHFLFSAKKYL